MKRLRWYQLAAEQGSGKAQSNLGLMYCKGEGVAQDYVLAHMWLNLAASRLPPGEERDKAVRNRDEVARKMTRAQIDEARRLARQWKPKPEQ